MLLFFVACATTDQPSEEAPQTGDTGELPAPDAPCTPSVWYGDGDGDGYGNPDTTEEACEAPPGFIADGGDCDDGDATIRPGAPHHCRYGVDLDCDGSVTDSCVVTPDLRLETWFGDVSDMGGDLDGDGLSDFLTGYGSTPYWIDAHDSVSVVLGAQIAAAGGAGVSGPAFSLEETLRNFGGDRVAWLDDIEGDGGSELLITSMPFDDGYYTYYNRVQLVTSSELLLGPVDETEPVFGMKADSATMFGYSLAALSDATGDGVADFVASYAKEADTQLHLYSGGDLAPFDAWNWVPGVGTLSMGEPYPGGLARIQEFDGSGMEFLATSGGDYYEGKLCVIPVSAFDAGSVDLADVGTCLTPVRRGTALVQAHDLDGDGLNEVLVGHAQAWGGREAEVPLPAASVYSAQSFESDGSPALTVVGGYAAEYWGYHVTAGGDLDGAGRADLVVSGLPIDYAGYRSGQYRMFQGEGLTPFSTVSLDDADGAWSSDDDAVPKLVGGGDFDGDGRADLVYRYLGAPAVLLGW